MNVRNIALAVALAAATVARADQVVFKNGDKITGKIETMDGGKMKIATAVAGEVTVDMKDVATFSTDEPIDIRTADGKKLNEQVAPGETDQVKASDGSVVALPTVSKINPPPEKWTGNVIVNGLLTRGNSNTESLGINVNAELRRNNDSTNDRFTLAGAYFFGRQQDITTGDEVTSTDNWMASGKYDRFWTPKFYTYGLMQVDHDRIAALEYRLSPGVGVGYQWIEKPDMNFNTEAGVSYVYEKYDHDGNDDHVALRLAYHFDKKLNDKVTFFHDLEWLPAFDDPSDYNLNTDAGLHVDLTKTFFSEFKFQWNRDSTPAPGAEKNDLKYLLGVGWKF